MANLCTVLLSVAAFHISTARSFPVQSFTISTDRLLDLTHPFNNETVYWVEHDKAGWNFDLRTIEENEKRGFYFRSNRFHAAEHGGTHIDLPSHYIKNGLDAADVKPADLIGPAIVLNVTDKCTKNRLFALGKQDILDWEAQYGQIPDGAFVFLLTGIGLRWPNKQQLFGSDNIYDVKSLKYPAFSEESANFLIHDRKAKGIGTDLGSLEHPMNLGKEFVHRVVAHANRIGIEFAANLEKLPPTGAFVMVAPMKITYGTGSPSNIVAVLPENFNITSAQPSG
ncbi:hypothetical protein RvY_04109 [Ramazzottius varieornatus]|uniref:Cyclase n=1 Tax=Ramazzottius varieornatus TaxID=947166 RepID=A0A1D1UZR9_RAMVA|nr:hypothetical protein RvY_04109 [Ramazzottius varieornatus]